MPNSESALARALTELAALGTERDREQMVALLDQLDAVPLPLLAVARGAALVGLR